MKTIDEIFANMPNDDREQLIDYIQIIEDPLSRDILGKLASPHSPIYSNNIPTMLFNAKEITILSRLKRMVNSKIIESKFVKENGKHVKKFDITEDGKTLATRYAKLEVAKHTKYYTDES